MDNPATPHPQPEPIILVIFGITGDLAQRKLLPALCNLFSGGQLHPDSQIVGISRRDVSVDDLLRPLSEHSNQPDGLETLRSSLRMQRMSLEDGAEYDELRTVLDEIEQAYGSCMKRLFYLSVPPQSTTGIVTDLGSHGLNQTCQHGGLSRLLVEKPFGYDLASAEQLIKTTADWFSEEQLFRIDHYVAKETAQNILVFRLFNPIFSNDWDSRTIAGIEITAYEQITIEGRVDFYEGVGALRDFIQNHLLQLLTIVTMELPQRLDSESIHAAKLALLESIQPITAEQVASHTTRGQYDGYRDEVGNQDSITETYASLDLSIETPRWSGVPVTVRTGKAMSRKLTQVKISFKDADDSDHITAPIPNELIFSIQPTEGISLQLNAKRPGFDKQLQPVTMDFNYDPQQPSPDAYERVLVDAARGDHTLFTTGAEVLAAWRVVEQVLRTWSNDDNGLVLYQKGSVVV